MGQKSKFELKRVALQRCSPAGKKSFFPQRLKTNGKLNMPHIHVLQGVRCLQVTAFYLRQCKNTCNNYFMKYQKYIDKKKVEIPAVVISSANCREWVFGSFYSLPYNNGTSNMAAVSRIWNKHELPFLSRLMKPVINTQIQHSMHSGTDVISLFGSTRFKLYF